MKTFKLVYAIFLLTNARDIYPEGVNEVIIANGYFQYYNNVINSKLSAADYADGLKNHGCHCKRLSNSDEFGGPAIDVTDSACQIYFYRRNSLELEGGPCFGKKVSENVIVMGVTEYFRESYIIHDLKISLR